MGIYTDAWVNKVWFECCERERAVAYQCFMHAVRRACPPQELSKMRTIREVLLLWRRQWVLQCKQWVRSSEEESDWENEAKRQRMQWLCLVYSLCCCFVSWFTLTVPPVCARVQPNCRRYAVILQMSFSQTAHVWTANCRALSPIFAVSPPKSRPEVQCSTGFGSSRQEKQISWVDSTWYQCYSC